MLEEKQIVLDEEERNEPQEYLAHISSLQADFTNYKRRVEREHGEIVEMANDKLLLKLLPVLDDFDRALENVASDSENKDWVNGVELVDHRLRSILENEGLSQIEAMGHEFDPQKHEAVFTVEGTADEQGKISSVVRKGYRLHDKVIRPAQVSVLKDIKSEPQSITRPTARRTVPITRGGDARWIRPSSARNVRGMFL
jgi:molecular chaperone GrpE